MSRKLNVLFIITDQQRADHLGCAGNPILKTPNIDCLASEGVRFTNAFCANPICTPNRASILTGLYPNMHGARSNGIKLPENIPTITQTLLQQGWHTVAIGKLHHQFFNDPHPNFTDIHSAERISDWFSPEKGPSMRERFKKKPYYGYKEVELVIGHGDLCTGHYFDWLEEKKPELADYIKEHITEPFSSLIYETNIPEDFFPTSYVTERTIEFLERYADGKYGERPFFLFCSYPDPHHPLCPPGKYKDMYKPKDIELPSNFDDLENLKDHPFLGSLIKNPPFGGGQAHLLERGTTEGEARQFIASTYGCISLIDYGVGKILNSLDGLGLADNTLIIYTSDHGDLMGDHGMILKGPCPYNGILNVPMIWKVPGLVQNMVSDSLISSIDIVPTLLKLLRIGKRYHPHELQGIDISPILKNPSMKLRDCCLIEEDEEFFSVKIRLRHLITENYKITVYNNLRNYGEIFDRKNDPEELNNLWFKDEDLRHQLLEKLFYENLSAQSRYPSRITSG